MSGPILILGILLTGCEALPELPVPECVDTIISGVTVINPGSRRLEDFSIVLREGTIREVRPRVPSDPEPICEGCYAIPGLIDAHIHTPPRIASGNQELFSLLYLAYGITTVRDVGASEDSVAELADRLNRGALVGPRMLRCGPVLDGDPPGWPIARVIGNAQAGIDVVNELAAEGVDCIKVYNEMAVESFAAISSAAARHGLPLVGHVPHRVGLERVSNFEAQHMTGVPYLALPRPPVGWDIRMADVLAMSDGEIDRAFDVAIRQNVSFTPTLANFRLRLIASDPERFPPTEASDILSAYWANAWDLVAGHPSTEEAIELQLEAIPAMHALVGRAHARGIDILAGTDTIMPWVVPGESLHLEMLALSDALGSVESALSAATTVNGRHLAPGKIGVIAPDAHADILLMRRDPTLDLTALREWQTVFVAGRRYDRPMLDEWIVDYRRYFHSAYQRSVMRPLAAVAVRFFSDN